MKPLSRLAILVLGLLPSSAVTAQNLLPNPSFESGLYDIMTQEFVAQAGYYQYWYPWLPTNGTVHGPYAPGQFTGDHFQMWHGVFPQVVYSNTSGVRDWNNPYKWIAIDLDDANCVDYSMADGAGLSGGALWTINHDTFPNRWDDRITNVKFHAADWYKNGPWEGRWFYLLGNQYGDPYSYPSYRYFRLNDHYAKSGASYAGMRANALIQTEVALEPYELYKFTCAIKPVMDAGIDPYSIVEYPGGGAYSNYFSWNSTAQLKVILAKNKMVYEHADCYSSKDNPAFKEKQCGPFFDQQLLEFTVASLDPAQLDFNGGQWQTLTAYLRAPANANIYQWLGIELQGNSSHYIILDDVSLVKMPGGFDCEEDLTISNQMLYDWAGNDRSSSTYIHIGPGVTVPTGANSRMVAEGHIEILPGFITANNCFFSATIGDCEAFSNTLAIYGVPDACDNVNARLSQPDTTRYSSSYKMYPNPAAATLTISGISGASSITLMTADGRVLATEQYATESVSLDVSGFAPGLYLVQVNDLSGIRTQTFVKQ
jgi:hypothetical protein